MGKDIDSEKNLSYLNGFLAKEKGRVKFLLDSGTTLSCLEVTKIRRCFNNVFGEIIRIAQSGEEEALPKIIALLGGSVDIEKKTESVSQDT
jgi:hypothetical protein